MKLTVSIPDINKLASKFRSRYELVVLASKRARELVDGARPLVRVNSKNPLDIALAEIAAGKIKARRIRSSAKVEEIRPGESMQNLEGWEL